MTAQREDILVSVCFPAPPKDAEQLARLTGLVDRLDARFRYWEMIITADETQLDLVGDRVGHIANLRVLKVRGQSQLYRARVIAAAEAIGDVVVLSSFEEMEAVDPVSFAEEADQDNVIVTATRAKGGALTAYPLYMLGRASSFQVEPRDLMTSAYPRTILNTLLARHDRQLALRFPPRGRLTPVVRHTVKIGQGGARRLSEISRRISLVQSLMIHASPMVLSALALISILAFVSSIAFAGYAVGAYFVLDEIQPGWLTTSLAISGTTGFLGAAMFGLSTGLLHVIELLTPDTLDDVVDEESGVDLFSKVANDLNVTQSSDTKSSGTQDRQVS